MSATDGCRIPAPKLGGRRGVLVDWITQRWVQATGRRVALTDQPWLDGPVGDVDLVGSDFFHRFAARRGLRVDAVGRRGLVDDMERLAGPTCDVAAVDSRVAAFYEETSEYDLDAWSEWCGAFRPFGGALAAVFSRRLRQLNVPLSPMDTSLGVTSDVLRLVATDGAVAYTAWVRDLVSTRRTLYAGSYSVCTPPGFAGPCVKVVFPLPNGSAVVVLRPESAPDGSLVLTSSGDRFGDPGFYFYVEQEPGRGWARMVRTLRERIRVFVDDRGVLRTDHDLRIWGAQFLRLHYRMRRRDGGRPVVGSS